jgi:G3E family GTPase
LEGKTPPKSIVILENEIGEANVDGLLLANRAYEVRSLTQGCLCCTLTGQFLEALKEIRRDLAPLYLLVDVSGVAHQTVIDVITSAWPGFKPFNIAVADAARWQELIDRMPMLIGSQLLNADLILINKAETVSADDLDRLEGDMDEINPVSPRFRLSVENDNLEFFWSQMVVTSFPELGGDHESPAKLSA